jgi:hypothetical protein
MPGSTGQPRLSLVCVAVGAEMSGDATVLCVNTKDKFDYRFLVDTNPPCPANYSPKGFALLQLPNLQVDGLIFTVE